MKFVKSGYYKPGIRWVMLENGMFFLEQNKATNSLFATAAKAGHKIWWNVEDEPVPGKLKYTGYLMLDGRMVSKKEAHDILWKKFNTHHKKQGVHFNTTKKGNVFINGKPSNVRLFKV